MSASNESVGCNAPIGLLGVVFVTLKLTHAIDWSWWWVTCPFWGGAAIALSILVPVLVVFTIAALRDR